MKKQDEKIFHNPENKEELNSALIGNWKNGKGTVLDIGVSEIEVEVNGRVNITYSTWLNLAIFFADDDITETMLESAQSGKDMRPILQARDKDIIVATTWILEKDGLFTYKAKSLTALYKVSFENNGKKMIWKFVGFGPEYKNLNIARKVHRVIHSDISEFNR